MKISFGMIFSIILIVIFIAFAFYGISKFLDYQKTIQIGQFTTYFQEDIDKMWRGSQGAVTAGPYTLPSKIEYVCFADFSKSSLGLNKEFYHDFQLVSSGGEKNMFFYPKEASEGRSFKINHLNIQNITKDENPYCIETIKGKIEINIKKDLGENLVTIE